jgi:hypothetical protein
LIASWLCPYGFEGSAGLGMGVKEGRPMGACAISSLLALQSPQRVGYPEICRNCRITPCAPRTEGGGVVFA